MPARFSPLANGMHYKATRRVETEKLKMRTVAFFVALAVFVMLLVVVRPTLRSNALSSRVGHRQAGRPLLLAQEQRRSSAARAADAHDSNVSSLSRVATVASGGGGRSGDRLSIKEGEESLMLDSVGFRAAVAASCLGRNTPSCCHRAHEPLLFRRPLREGRARMHMGKNWRELALRVHGRPREV